MDPDELLKQLLASATRIHELDDMPEEEDGKGIDVLGDVCQEASDVADGIQNLDGWITKGGFLPEAWTKTCNGGLLMRAVLLQAVIKVVDEYVVEHVDDDSGPFYAYFSSLMGVILDGKTITLDPHDPDDVDFMNILHSLFNEDHDVWHHITD